MLTSVTFCLVSVPMAERNDNQLTKLHSKMIVQLAGQGNNELDPQLVEMLERLKCADQRKELDTLLGKINETLIDIDSVRHTLDTDDSAFPGERPRDIVLTKIDDCREIIVEIRDQILECMKQHTELYLMVKDVSEFVTEFKDFELDISGISKHANYKVLEVVENISIAVTGLGFIIGHGRSCA